MQVQIINLTIGYVAPNELTLEYSLHGNIIEYDGQMLLSKIRANSIRKYILYIHTYIDHSLLHAVCCVHIFTTQYTLNSWTHVKGTRK